MYYVPNILIRRSRSKLLLTVSPDTTWDYSFSFTILSGQQVFCDFGDGTQAVLTSADSNVTQTKTYPAGTYTIAFNGGVYGAVLIKSSNRQHVTWCNFNWRAFPLLTSLNNFLFGCSSLTGVVKSPPSSVAYMSSSFGNCPLLTLEEGFSLPSGVVGCYRLFAGWTNGPYDINDLGDSFPMLTTISEMFQGASGFYGDATVFKNKCVANVVYVNAFTGSSCTNIPA